MQRAPRGINAELRVAGIRAALDNVVALYGAFSPTLQKSNPALEEVLHQCKNEIRYAVEKLMNDLKVNSQQLSFETRQHIDNVLALWPNITGKLPPS